MFLMVPLGLFHIFFRLNSKTVNNAYTTWPTMVNTRFTQIKFKKGHRYDDETIQYHFLNYFVVPILQDGL